LNQRRKKIAVAISTAICAQATYCWRRSFATTSPMVTPPHVAFWISEYWPPSTTRATTSTTIAATSARLAQMARSSSGT
jgi:hypothetical protein